MLNIDDLPFALRKAHGTMYADDTAISYSLDKIEEIDVVVNTELAEPATNAILTTMRLVLTLNCFTFN